MPRCTPHLVCPLARSTPIIDHNFRPICCARLVPGRVLLGKYPGQIPADFPTEWQTARDRVKEVIMRGGVTDLLSLQVRTSH